MKKQYLGLGLAIMLGVAIVAGEVGCLKTYATENTESVTEDKPSFQIGGKTMVITENLNPAKYPNGFESAQISCEGDTYRGLKAKNGDMQLLCLMEEDTGDAAYYIFNPENGSVAPFVRIQNEDETIIVIPKSMMGDVSIPDGYVTSEVEIDGYEVTAYETESEVDYLLYAMNSEGNREWFVYSEDGSFTSYTDMQEQAQEAAVQGQEEAEQEADAYQEKYEQLKKTTDSQISRMRLIISVMAVVIVVLLIIMITLLVRMNQGSYDGEEEYDEEYDEDIDEDDMTEECVDEQSEEEEFIPLAERKEVEKVYEVEPEIQPESQQQPVPEPQQAPPAYKQAVTYSNDIEVLDLNDL